MNTTAVNDPFAQLGLTRPAEVGTERDEVGQEDYLTLMLAQFRNQDPFEPMTNGEFLGQIAQFGTVSGIQELQDSFAGLSAALQSDQTLQAASLVGRQVLARGDSARLQAEQPIDGAVRLGNAAASVEIDVTDSSGQIVRTFGIGDRGAGLAEFRWDGLGSDGEPLPEGEYRFSARAADSGAALETLLVARIDSVSIGANGRDLTLNTSSSGSLDLADVERIL